MLTRTWNYIVCLVAVIGGAASLIDQGHAAAADKGLVAYWKFDEGTGDIAVDSSGNGSDAGVTRIFGLPPGGGQPCPSLRRLGQENRPPADDQPRRAAKGGLPLGLDGPHAGDPPQAPLGCTWSWARRPTAGGMAYEQIRVGEEKQRLKQKEASP